MSAFQPATYEEAKATHKPLSRRIALHRVGAKPNAIPATPGRKPRRTSGIKRGARKKKARRVKASTLKKKAWKEFSIFIRSRGADAEGFTKCVTCPIRKHWKEMQGGHFIAGRLNSNLFDERGCHPQCSLCNVVKHGNGPMYYKFMLATYGQEVIDELLRQNDVTKKWQPGELQQIWKKYRGLNEANQSGVSI